MCIDWCHLQVNVRFGEDWARLTRDLLFDSEGSLKFKKDLWNDVRKVILPELVDKVLPPRSWVLVLPLIPSTSQIGYIPIPRIETIARIILTSARLTQYR